MSGIQPASRLTRLNGARIGLLDPVRRAAGAVLKAVGGAARSRVRRECGRSLEKPSPYCVRSKKAEQQSAQHGRVILRKLERIQDPGRIGSAVGTRERERQRE